MLRAPPVPPASLFAIWRESARGPGRVKTCLGEGCAELFSQLPSSERSCQYNRLPHRRNRDGSSPRKLGIRVFTQPGSKADLARGAIEVSSYLNNGDKMRKSDV